MISTSKQAGPATDDIDAAADQAIAACGGVLGGRARGCSWPSAFSRPRPQNSGRGGREGNTGDGSQGRANARMRQMSEVTYYVALPFVFFDDGMAAGEAAECLSANAAVMRAEALSRKPGHAGAIAFSRTVIHPAATSATPPDPEVR